MLLQSIETRTKWS